MFLFEMLFEFVVLTILVISDCRELTTHKFLDSTHQEGWMFSFQVGGFVQVFFSRIYLDFVQPTAMPCIVMSGISSQFRCECRKR